MSKNAMIVDGTVLKKGEMAVLRKESEIIIGGEPVIVSNYEYVNSPPAKEDEWFGMREEIPPVQGLNLKDCLVGYCKYRRVAEQRKEYMGMPPYSPS